MKRHNLDPKVVSASRSLLIGAPLNSTTDSRVRPWVGIRQVLRTWITVVTSKSRATFCLKSCACNAIDTAEALSEFRACTEPGLASMSLDESILKTMGNVRSCKLSCTPEPTSMVLAARSSMPDGSTRGSRRPASRGAHALVLTSIKICCHTARSSLDSQEALGRLLALGGASSCRCRLGTIFARPAFACNNGWFHSKRTFS